MTAEVECRACAAGIPLIWFVQGKQYMHEAPGLSVTACKRIASPTRRACDSKVPRGR